MKIKRVSRTKIWEILQESHPETVDFMQRFFKTFKRSQGARVIKIVTKKGRYQP